MTISGELYLRRVRRAMRLSPEETKAIPSAEYTTALRAIAFDVATRLDVRAQQIIDEIRRARGGAK